ncbi:MAG: DUF421 domain-containing protein [Clostridiales bacterium]|jgi:uncharacterized membrane protein YcaP (DUF421 family)|nr:DUF421 domain-containing protein [Clostridiales bacterium]
MIIVLCRAAILFVVIMISMRILGKRQLGEMEPAEFVIALVISDLASVPIENIGVPLLYALFPITLLVSLELLITYGTLKSLNFRILVCGKPSIVIENGKINQSEMSKSRISVNELFEQLRGKNVSDISQVKYAILETSGEFNVILFSEHSPVTVSDLKIEYEDKGLPIAVIDDGKLIKKNMRIRNIDRQWLDSYLKKRKLPQPKEIFLMTIDDQGNIYISEKERKR